MKQKMDALDLETVSFFDFLSHRPNNTVVAYRRDVVEFVSYLREMKIISLDSIDFKCIQRYVVFRNRDHASAR